MKKAYLKPEAKKVSFQYNKVVANSGYCDQGWTIATTKHPVRDGCAKCEDDLIWLNEAEP